MALPCGGWASPSLASQVVPAPLVSAEEARPWDIPGGQVAAVLVRLQPEPLASRMVVFLQGQECPHRLLWLTAPSTSSRKDPCPSESQDLQGTGREPGPPYKGLAKRNEGPTLTCLPAAGTSSQLDSASRPFLQGEGLPH